MNREIKFRAWDKEKKMMLYTDWDSFRNWYDEPWIGRVVHERGWLEEELVMSDPMQYTGLKDKNGVEIYEGDIVGWKNIVFESDKLYKGFVIMSEGFWGVVELRKHKIPKETLDFLKNTNNENMINHFYDMNLFALVDDELQILGNIFENPELLKEAEL